MSKKDWDDIVKEPMSEGLKARTMAWARQELGELQSAKAFNWAWLIPLVPGLAALLFFSKTWKNEDDAVGPVAGGKDLFETMAKDSDLLEEFESMSSEELANLDPELVADLEFYQDLDVLEDWDGQEES